MSDNKQSGKWCHLVDTIPVVLCWKFFLLNRFSSQFLTDPKSVFVIMPVWVSIYCFPAGAPLFLFLFLSLLQGAVYPFIFLYFNFFPFLFLSFPGSLPSLVSSMDSEVLLKAQWDCYHREADLPLDQRWSSQSHTSEHAAAANAGLLGEFLLIILPSAHLPPLCFGLAHPAPNFIALSAEEQMESNLSAQLAASAVPHWDPSTGCSVPASSLLFVPQLPLDQMKNMLINVYLNSEVSHSLLEIIRIALLCVETSFECLLIIFRAAMPGAPAHPGSSSPLVRSKWEMQVNKWRDGKAKQGKRGKNNQSSVFTSITLTRFLQQNFSTVHKF